MPSTYLPFGLSLAGLDNDPQCLAGIRQQLANIALPVAHVEPVTALVREQEQVLARGVHGRQGALRGV